MPNKTRPRCNGNLHSTRASNMFELSELKQNRFYQKVLAERQAENRLQDKLEAVPIMLQHGFTAEETSTILGLTLEQVFQAA